MAWTLAAKQLKQLISTRLRVQILDLFIFFVLCEISVFTCMYLYIRRQYMAYTSTRKCIHVCAMMNIAYTSIYLLELNVHIYIMYIHEYLFLYSVYTCLYMLIQVQIFHFVIKHYVLAYTSMSALVKPCRLLSVPKTMPMYKSWHGYIYHPSQAKSGCLVRKP